MIFNPDQFDLALMSYIEKLTATIPDENHTFIYDPKNTYIQVIHVSYSARSSHSFICKKDDPKFGFKRGDILKSASWKAPAKNFARGNVFDTSTYESKISWTGW